MPNLKIDTSLLAAQNRSRAEAEACGEWPPLQLDEAQPAITLTTYAKQLGITRRALVAIRDNDPLFPVPVAITGSNRHHWHDPARLNKWLQTGGNWQLILAKRTPTERQTPDKPSGGCEGGKPSGGTTSNGE